MGSNPYLRIQAKRWQVPQKAIPFTLRIQLHFESTQARLNWPIVTIHSVGPARTPDSVGNQERAKTSSLYPRISFPGGTAGTLPAPDSPRGFPSLVSARLQTFLPSPCIFTTERNASGPLTRTPRPRKDQEDILVRKSVDWHGVETTNFRSSRKSRLISLFSFLPTRRAAAVTLRLCFLTTVPCLAHGNKYRMMVPSHLYRIMSIKAK